MILTTTDHMRVWIKHGACRSWSSRACHMDDMYHSLLCCVNNDSNTLSIASGRRRGGRTQAQSPSLKVSGRGCRQASDKKTPKQHLSASLYTKAVLHSSCLSKSTRATFPMNKALMCEAGGVASRPFTFLPDPSSMQLQPRALSAESPACVSVEAVPLQTA